MTVTEPLRQEHADLLPHLAELDFAAADLDTWRSCAPNRLKQLRAQLYGLSAILHLHFNKEEQVLLPVLDAHMSADDAERLFARMRAVAHPHEGSAT